MSFNHPHPPLTPLAGYLDIYREIELGGPSVGEWAKEPERLPYALRMRRQWSGMESEARVRMARQAFYALSTHVDHQIRAVIGTLREHGLHDDTVIMLTADHGDMLGSHGLWGKTLFYEESAKIPMLLVPDLAQAERLGYAVEDDRLAVQADVMPTLLEMCGIPVPDTVEGLSLVGGRLRDYVYGDMYEDARASRMVRDRRHKLIYYPAGNRTQLFDMENDRDELIDVSEEPAYAEARQRLTELLVDDLYGTDLEWLDGGRLVGTPEPSDAPTPDRGLANQRGYRFR
jgi:arylsulfatase A-like enzyme